METQSEILVESKLKMSKRIEFFELNELIPYSNNARTHSNKQIDQIRRSIEEFGFTNPILIDKTKGIIAGHGRFQAATDLGLTHVPVIVLDHLTDIQKRAYILADNQLALQAGWDEDLLAEELITLRDEDFDLSVLGWDDDELGDILPPEPGLDPDGSEDEVPEVADNIHKVKLGDIYQLGEHRLMCGDSTDKATVDKLMNGEKADMVFTDPPYGVNAVTDDNTSGSRTHKTNKAKKGRYKKIIGDDNEFSVSFLLDLAPNVFIFGGNYFAHEIPRGTHWLVWNKRGREELERQHTTGDCELVWTNQKRVSVTNYTHAWAGMFRAGNKKDELKTRVHPTQKPVTLLANMLNDYKFDSVIDLFLGSGTTLIACEKTNRKCYGSEIDPHYCSVIITRWEQYTGKKAKKII